MEIRKASTPEEWMETDKVIANAFLHKWDEKEAEKKYKLEKEGKLVREEEAWRLFDDQGKNVSCIITSQHFLSMDEKWVSCGEMNMVGSLPEGRSSGNIRMLMREIMSDMKERGNVFVFLYPFSHRFYRKFGFELAERQLKQSVAISDLSDFECTYGVKAAESQEDVNELKKLYEKFALQRNLRNSRKEKDWIYKGNGEFGERDFWQGDKQKYTYLFFNGEGIPCAYFSFTFEPDPQNFTIGTMQISDFVYGSAEDFYNMLGFIYSMRSKVRMAELCIPEGPDLALIIPEGKNVSVKYDCGMMLRTLDVEMALRLKKHPAGRGSYTIAVEDSFCPENTGTYRTEYLNGQVQYVERTDEKADAKMTQETFTQLVTGMIGLREAQYRTGTWINSNRELLEQVFLKR